MTHRTIVKCACGHYDEIITINGRPSREELAAYRRQPCIRCQIAAREVKR